MGVFDVILSYVTNSAMQLMLSLITDVIGSKVVKINYEKLFDEFLECVGDTQKEFARHYNEKYESDTTTLFSHILYILANREFEKAELDEIVEQFIRNSFNTEPTNQMIEDWKRYLVENINDAQYSGLKIYLTSIKENHDVAYVKEEEAHYGTTSIFLSYSWEDEEKADEIDTFFKALGIDIKRDKKSIEQWGSIRAFMDSIQESDYAILIISDAYLKSVNCMYEITQLMKDTHYKDRIFPVVLENDIYHLKKRIDYIVYWEEKYDEIKQEISRVKNIENTEQLSRELHQIREISYTIGEFLDIIKDMNNPQAEGISQAIYERLCDKKLMKRNTKQKED